MAIARLAVRLAAGLADDALPRELRRLRRLVESIACDSRTRVARRLPPERDVQPIAMRDRRTFKMRRAVGSRGGIEFPKCVAFLGIPLACAEREDEARAIGAFLHGERRRSEACVENSLVLGQRVAVILPGRNARLFAPPRPRRSRFFARHQVDGDY